jgi:hypothetical protein
MRLLIEIPELNAASPFYDLDSTILRITAFFGSLMQLFISDQFRGCHDKKLEIAREIRTYHGSRNPRYGGNRMR